MGLSDEEFGGLTYAMFEALLARKKEEDRKHFICAAMMTAATINYSPIHDPNKPVKVMDLVPEDLGGEKPKNLDEMEPAEATAHMMTQFAKRTVSHR